MPVKMYMSNASAAQLDKLKVITPLLMPIEREIDWERQKEYKEKVNRKMSLVNILDRVESVGSVWSKSREIVTGYVKHCINL